MPQILIRLAISLEMHAGTVQLHRIAKKQVGWGVLQKEKKKLELSREGWSIIRLQYDC